MPKLTLLEKQWQELMTLCADEAKFNAEGNHAKLLNVIASRIEELAAEMGFSGRRIVTRDFRAERDGDRILRIITD
jgi:hypothetical protein